MRYVEDGASFCTGLSVRNAPSTLASKSPPLNIRHATENASKLISRENSITMTGLTETSLTDDPLMTGTPSKVTATTIALGRSAEGVFSVHESAVSSTAAKKRKRFILATAGRSLPLPPKKMQLGKCNCDFFLAESGKFLFGESLVINADFVDGTGEIGLPVLS